MFAKVRLPGRDTRSLNLNQHFASTRHGNGQLMNRQHLRPAALVERGGTHRVGSHGLPHHRDAEHGKDHVRLHEVILTPRGTSLL